MLHLIPPALLVPLAPATVGPLRGLPSRDGTSGTAGTVIIAASAAAGGGGCGGGSGGVVLSAYNQDKLCVVILAAKHIILSSCRCLTGSIVSTGSEDLVTVGCLWFGRERQCVQIEPSVDRVRWKSCWHAPTFCPFSDMAGEHRAALPIREKRQRTACFQCFVLSSQDPERPRRAAASRSGRGHMLSSLQPTADLFTCTMSS